VRAFLTFYDAGGTVIEIDQASFVASSTSTWTQLSVSAIAPAGASWVVVGVDDYSASAAIYLDDAWLIGSNQYSYL